jgi:hypothetical protein
MSAPIGENAPQNDIGVSMASDRKLPSDYHKLVFEIKEKIWSIFVGKEPFE